MEQDNKMFSRDAVRKVAGEGKKNVQTYAEDMARVIEDSKGGLIKKIIHEEEEHEKEKMNLSPESKRNKLFMFLSFLFILLGLITMLYFGFRKKDSAVLIEKQFVPLIFNDTSAFIEVAGFNKDKIIQTVYNAVKGTKVKTGEVEGIYLINNKKNVGLREFIKLVKGNFVAGDNTLFVSDTFLLGAVNNEGRSIPAGASAEKDFFMLLKTRSTADIFNAMRAWEGKMFFDLHGFFGLDITSENKYLITKEFKNGIIYNKNARVLYDGDNKIVMMYVFADDNSVIVTNTENTTYEIMLRLAASRIKK